MVIMEASLTKGEMKMKNSVLTVLISVTLALVCVLVGITFAGGVKGSANITNGTVLIPDTVSVYGQGRISIKPDVAYLNMGYENTNINPEKAQNENSDMMEKIMNALKKSGIEETGIRTSRYNVIQEYDYSGSTKKLIGYKVTNMINVEIKDVDNVGEIINVAINAGGNVFNGISFDIKDRQQVYLDAMDMALERAYEKAQIYAEKGGRNISKILEINEGSSASTTYTPQLRNEVSLNYAQNLTGQGVMASGEASSISAGQLEIAATVTVIYALD